MKREDDIVKKIEEIKDIIANLQSPEIKDSVFLLGFYSGFLAALSWVISKDLEGDTSYERESRREEKDV